ncbi:MAG TPA: hypothetical protein QF804_01315 [Rhodospirillales bacterium]|nr:hypothetical protein [Rhodospirillales bacterium]HJO68304.1 hypothetical protein [Rhodospirillales bacterium]
MNLNEHARFGRRVAGLAGVTVIVVADLEEIDRYGRGLDAVRGTDGAGDVTDEGPFLRRGGGKRLCDDERHQCALPPLSRAGAPPPLIVP